MIVSFTVNAGGLASGLVAMALAAGWLPVSALLLRRGRMARQAEKLASQAMQAQLQVELFRAGRRDRLTGLQGRLGFRDQLSAAFATGARLAVLLVDVDRLSSINASFGEAAGDELLRTLAQSLAGLAHSQDRASRLDGDEFALLIDNPGDLDDLPGMAARVLATLSGPNAAAGQLIEVHVSIGLAASPAHGTDPDTLMRSARLALLQAKEAGGRSWHSCGPELSLVLHTRQRFRQELGRAIGIGQVVPWYQPIMHLPSGGIAKFEVLARWHHPESGILTPDQFIPLADELGLSGRISMALLRQVAVDSQEWPPDCRFAFNVSAGQVRELIGLLNAQPGEWQRRMDFSRLDVEITEAALMHDREMARELIDTLHDHGARAGLDNFGSGVSNLSFLRDMPFDSIKIGKIFIQTMLDDPRAEACVMAMLWLGKGLALDVVADGVEAQAVADRLATMECRFAQGYLYARPMPAEDVKSLFIRPTPVASHMPAAATRVQPRRFLIESL